MENATLVKTPEVLAEISQHKTTMFKLACENNKMRKLMERKDRAMRFNEICDCQALIDAYQAELDLVERFGGIMTDSGVFIDKSHLHWGTSIATLAVLG